LVLAERFAALCAQMASFDPEAMSPQQMACRMEIIGILYVVPVLFEKKETVLRGLDLLAGKPSKNGVSLQRIELQG
jgi:hypothetical protein